MYLGRFRCWQPPHRLGSGVESSCGGHGPFPARSGRMFRRRLLGRPGQARFELASTVERCSNRSQERFRNGPESAFRSHLIPTRAEAGGRQGADAEERGGRRSERTPVGERVCRRRRRQPLSGGSRTRSLNAAHTGHGMRLRPMQKQNRRTQGEGRPDGCCCYLRKSEPAEAVWGRSPAGSCVSSNKEDRERL
jgi:hypothetical protein